MSHAEPAPALAPTGARVIVISALAASLGTAPAFLVGSLASFMRQEFSLTAAELGAAVTTFFVLSAITVIPGGRFSERVGARRAILLACSVSGAASLGVALGARSVLTLSLYLAVGGAANGVLQPACNLALARGVRLARLGIAFGIKQSAIPTATLIAGAAVPLLGLTAGWRWAYAGIAAVIVGLGWLLPRDLDAMAAPVGRQGRGARGEGDAPLRTLVILGFATGCGAAVANSLAAFYVSSAVDAGVTIARAGTLLVIGSVAVIIVRVTIGWLVDLRDIDYLPLVKRLMLAGSVGFLWLSVARGFVPILGATLIVFMAGWGWPGLFNLAVVRMNPGAPGTATAITQAGVFIGGMLGPIAFGLLVTAAGYGAAWVLGFALSLLGAAAMTFGERSAVGMRRP
jgi:MFS family permease